MSLLPRGVYRASYLSESGHPLLVAITEDHRRIATREVTTPDQAIPMLADLWNLLDQADPEYKRRSSARALGLSVAGALTLLVL